MNALDLTHFLKYVYRVLLVVISSSSLSLPSLVVLVNVIVSCVEEISLPEAAN